MITEQDIRDFLVKTEEFLHDLPMSEREAAMAQWKEELQRYAEKMPGADFLALKHSLGGPRGAANFLRLQRGFTLHPARKSYRKAILLTLGAVIVLLSILVGVLVWKFTPLFSVREDRVQVLGGLIDIDGQLGQVKIGDSYEYTDPQFKNVFEGSYEIPVDQVEDVLIEFDRGQLEVSYTPEARLVWNCKVSAEPGEGFIRQEKELLVVNLKSVGGTQCDFKVPTRLKYTVSGDAGKVDIIAPANDTFVQLGNGMVVIGPDSENSYRFDLKVGQGTVDPSLNSMSSEEGIEIKVELGNGSIQKK